MMKGAGMPVAAVCSEFKASCSTLYNFGWVAVALLNYTYPASYCCNL